MHASVGSLTNSEYDFSV